MKKSRFKSFIIASALAMVISSCSPSSPSSEDPSSLEQRQREIYQLAVSSGYEGTYEDWLNSIKGEEGSSFRIGEGQPGWQLGNTGDTYLDSITWTIYKKTTHGWEVVGNIMGSQGEPGKDGKDGQDGAPGKDGEDGTPGKDGVSIVKIEKTGTNGLVDTYTIYYSNDTTSTFEVTNGKDGSSGGGSADIEIINGNWYVNGVDTGVRAVAVDGNGIKNVVSSQTDQGTLITIIQDDNSSHSFIIPNGKDGKDGKNGRGIADFTTEEVEGGTKITFIYDDGTESSVVVPNGKDGADGKNGQNGAPGTPGENGKNGKGIESVDAVEVEGGIQITITFDDGDSSDIFVPLEFAQKTYLVNMTSRQEYDDYGELITINTYYYSDGTSREEVVSKPRTVSRFKLLTDTYVYNPADRTFFPELKAVVYYLNAAQPEVVTLDASNIPNIDKIDLSSNERSDVRIRLNNYFFPESVYLVSPNYPSYILSDIKFDEKGLTLETLEECHYYSPYDFGLYSRVPCIKEYYSPQADLYREETSTVELYTVDNKEIRTQGEHQIIIGSSRDNWGYMTTLKAVDTRDITVSSITLRNDWTVDVSKEKTTVQITYQSGRMEIIDVPTDSIQYYGLLGMKCYATITIDNNQYAFPYPIEEDEYKDERYRFIDSTSTRVSESHPNLPKDTVTVYSLEELEDELNELYFETEIAYENGTIEYGEPRYTRENFVFVDNLETEGELIVNINYQGEDEYARTYVLYDVESSHPTQVSYGNIYMEESSFNSDPYAPFSSVDLYFNYIDKFGHVLKNVVCDPSKLIIANVGENNNGYANYSFTYDGLSFNKDVRLYTNGTYDLSTRAKLLLEKDAFSSLDEVIGNYGRTFSHVPVELYYHDYELPGALWFDLSESDSFLLYINNLYNFQKTSGRYSLSMTGQYKGIELSGTQDLLVYDEKIVKNESQTDILVGVSSENVPPIKNIGFSPSINYYADGELLESTRHGYYSIEDVFNYVTNISEIDFSTIGEYTAHIVYESYEFNMLVRVIANSVQYVENSEISAPIGATMEDIRSLIVGREVVVHMADHSTYEYTITDDMVELPENIPTDKAGYQYGTFHFPVGDYRFTIYITFIPDPSKGYQVIFDNADNFKSIFSNFDVTDLKYYEEGYFVTNSISMNFHILPFGDIYTVNYFGRLFAFSLVIDEENKTATISDAELDLSGYEYVEYQVESNGAIVDGYTIRIYEGTFLAIVVMDNVLYFSECEIIENQVFSEGGLIGTIEGNIFHMAS